MGAPYFQHKRVMDQNHVVVFSSNYPLYGDMSQRVMESLQMLVPDVEVYSIDEAFLRLDGLASHDPFALALNIKDKILKWTGMPVSIGIGPTKTLAKIANHIAKKEGAGVFDIGDDRLQTKVMTDLPIEAVWGISHRWGAKLRAMGINTVLELRDSDASLIRGRLSVVAERIVHELRGLSQLGLSDISPKRNIMSSRSFGKLLTKLEPMQEALANYAVRACEKLRLQKSKAQGVYVFVRTNRFRKTDPQYRNSATLGFDWPTSDTGLIISTGVRLLKALYKDGYRYNKCGIMLLDLVPETYPQGHLFTPRDSPKRDQLMKVIDGLNRSMGADTIFHAAQGIEREWASRRHNCSPSYTTKWEELPKAYLQ